MGFYVGLYRFAAEKPRVSGVSTKRTGIGAPGALGRPKAAVIGTGRVEGIPVYGQTKVVTTNYKGTRIGSQFYLTYPEPTSVATIDVGYLLCKDYFGRGYNIIRIEADDEVVFDAENGAAPKIAFRFYNGLQTTVDPLVRTIVGANAGAHTGDVLLFLPDYPSLTAPTINVVISNAATESAEGGQIEWTGEVPSGILNAFPHGSAYDPADALIYQIFDPTDIPGLSHIYLAVLDVDTLQERYRVPLEGSEPYAVGRDVNDSQSTIPIAMAGTGLLLIQLYGAEATPRLSGIYDSATGHLIASQIDTANMIWLTVQRFGERWVFVGHNFDAGMGVTGIFDPAMGKFDVDPEGFPGSHLIVNGRVTSEFTSFFTATASFTGDADIYELRFDGDVWTSTLLHSLTGLSGLSASVLWFDSLTGYLVVGYGLPGPISRWLYIDPQTGSTIDTFDTSKMGSNATFASLHNRMISRPGYVLMFWSDGDPDEPLYEILSLNIQEKTISTLADEVVPRFTVGEYQYLIADQARALWMSALGEYVWTVHRIPQTIPGQITLQRHITDILEGLLS
ncbi:hypothetical protein NKI86_16570 [Mesorhizobium sp. M0320]|uniref:hypothetical protein n=1 Tax=unclassified Mesorhizobium TaxID=325217 RepID=UPI0033385010